MDWFLYMINLLIPISHMFYNGLQLFFLFQISFILDFVTYLLTITSYTQNTMT